HVAAAGDVVHLLVGARLVVQLLARKHQAARAGVVFDGDLPADRGFHRVARTPDVVAGDVAQAGQVLDRLVGGAVFAQADGVVGVDVDGGRRNQAAHAHGVARVVGKHQEGGVVRHQAAMQRQAGVDGGHAELAHAVVDVVGVRAAFEDVFRAFPDRQVGAGQVGRAADQFRQYRAVGVERHLRGFARGHFGAFALGFGNVVRGDFFPVVGQLALDAATQFGRQFGMRLGVALEQGVPVGLALVAGLARVESGVVLVGN